MNSYSGLHALYMSFFSKDLYRSVVKHWKGVAFLYLFLIVMFSWMLISLKLFFVMNEAMNGPVKKLIDKLPAITIHDGELKIDKPSPYIVSMNPADSGDARLRDAQGDLNIIIFDATTDDVKAPENIPFIVSKHNFLVQSGNNPHAQEIELKQFGEMTLTRASFQEIADAIKIWVPLLVFFVCGPVSFCICAISALILAAIGMAVGNGTNIKLTYGECLRIASVAFTPAVIIDTLVKLLPFPQHPVWPLVTFGMAIGYTIFGVLSNKSPVTVEDSFPGGMPDESQ